MALLASLVARQFGSGLGLRVFDVGLADGARDGAAALGVELGLLDFLLHLGAFADRAIHRPNLVAEFRHALLGVAGQGHGFYHLPLADVPGNLADEKL